MRSERMSADGATSIETTDAPQYSCSARQSLRAIAQSPRPDLRRASSEALLPRSNVERLILLQYTSLLRFALLQLPRDVPVELLRADDGEEHEREDRSHDQRLA